MIKAPPRQHRVNMVLAASMAAVLALGCATATGSDDDSNGSENDGTGPLDVVTATTGSDPDPDGYQVTLDGATSQSIGINAQITFSDLAAGDHEVALSGVAGNCTVTGSSQRTVTVTADDGSQTTFAVTCAQGGGAGAGDIHSWDFESVGGPRNDRFGRFSFGGAPDNITVVQNAALAAQGEWFAQSLDLGLVGNNMPAWVYQHTDYEGVHADELYVRQRILFTAFAPDEDPKTLRFFNSSNTDLGYLLIRSGAGGAGPGSLEWHWDPPGNTEVGASGLFTANTWHWIEVGLTDISGSPRVRVWFNGVLAIDATGGASVGAVAQTRFLWAGGGAAEDQPFGYPMFVRFDQIDLATFHMGIP